MKHLSAALLMFLGCAVLLAAHQPAPGAPVPEIDPNSVVGVAALLGSALVMIRQRGK